MSYIVKNFSLLYINLAIAVKVLFTSILMTDIIKNNCDFDFYCNKTDVTPRVLDGGDEMVLANWPNDKHIICNVNNDIPIKIPSHQYVFINRSVLCNCRIEADNHHLLESIATCDNKITKLVIYFTINLVFTNYLDMLPNLTYLLPIIKDRTRCEQTLPLSILNFDSSLRHAPAKHKDSKNDYINNKEIFHLQQRHAVELFKSSKKFFSSYIVNIFTFTSSIISIITVMIVIYLFCKHKHIRTFDTGTFSLLQNMLLIVKDKLSSSLSSSSGLRVHN